MNSYIVWPDCWLNIAFVVVCILFAIILCLSRNGKKDIEIGPGTMQGMLQVVCAISLLSCFILSAILIYKGWDGQLEHGTFDRNAVFILFFAAGIIAPLGCVVFGTPECKKDEIIFAFEYALGNAIIGFFFIVLNNFSYFWCPLVFIIFDAIMLFVVEHIDKKWFR